MSIHKNGRAESTLNTYHLNFKWYNMRIEISYITISYRFLNKKMKLNVKK